MHLTGPQPTIKRARGLRQSMSLPEVLLYRELRKRPSGLVFRRQHPAGAYILDFFCPAARLCIEVDGEWHGSRHPEDARRDAWLMAQGIQTLRLAARDVLGNLDGVLRCIVQAALARLPTPAQAAPESPMFRSTTPRVAENLLGAGSTQTSEGRGLG